MVVEPSKGRLLRGPSTAPLAMKLREASLRMTDFWAGEDRGTAKEIAERVHFSVDIRGAGEDYLNMFTSKNTGGAENGYPLLMAIAAGLVYGVTMRLVYSPLATGHGGGFDNFAVMSVGFLVFVPFFMGWITVAAARADREFHFSGWIVVPWIAVVAGDGVVLLTRMEGWICVVMALPITLLFASLGGVASGLTARSRFRKKGRATFCLALLPFLVSGIESQFNAPLSVRTVNTSIVIHAPAEVVWRNIERVPAIRHDEIRPSWTHAIGFPLPVEATLDHEGVGGVRHASFEGGLMFIETINRWEPMKSIGFQIAADTAAIPRTTLDEHVTIGGRYFDVLYGEYDLEPLANGDVLLHLSSRQRLSTDFNAYAALWTEAAMRDLQVSILQVVKARCEGGRA